MLIYTTTTSFTFISSIRRPFSTSLPSAHAVNQNPPLESNFAVEYLVKSCGLSMETAIKASKRVPHLRSPEKSDSVLQYMRQMGVADDDVRKAVTLDPSILCASLENTIKPKVERLKELGFSPSMVMTTRLFTSKQSLLEERIKFWVSFFGSTEGLLSALKNQDPSYPLAVSIKNVVEPNISFLEGHCGVSRTQIKKLLMRRLSLATINPNKWKKAAQRAEDLGFSRGSGLFIYALCITLSCSSAVIDSKMKNLLNLGFSKKEIGSMIKKSPMLLSNSDERMQKHISFLTSEAGLDLRSIAHHPMLFTISLERRLIPRHYVLKSLKSKGLCQKWSFSSAMQLSEVRFEDLFVRPYRDIIPEVFQAYKAARAAKTKRQTLAALENL